MKAYYDQNRELILASKQDQYQANPKAKRDISIRIVKQLQEKKYYEVGVFAMFGCNMSYTHGTDVLYRVRVFVCEIGKRITPDQFALEYMLASFDTL